jgi:hypothetical protein
MEKYLVDFGTGAGNEYAETLEDAKRIAEANLAYTQQDVDIYEDDTLVTTLRWWGVQPEQDDVVTAQFGSFGFYGQWSDESEQW